MAAEHEIMLERVRDTCNRKLAEAAQAVAEQRKQVLTLLQELGFDTTILQGSSEQLAFDDLVVVQKLKAQLDKRFNRVARSMLPSVDNDKLVAAPIVATAVDDTVTKGVGYALPTPFVGTTPLELTTADERLDWSEDDACRYSKG